MPAITDADILARSGGACVVGQWGVSWRRRRMDGREVEAPTHTRADAASCATYFDQDGTLRVAAANKLRGSWEGGALGLLLEGARGPLGLYSRDLTNAAWTKTNVTAAKDQTGMDGLANSASSITASAGNGTCLQAITSGSSNRVQSAYVKRLVGAGAIQMTMDNGSTWTAVTVTSAWTRVRIPAQVLTNPTVGFRIVTNGDSIAVDFAQHELGAFEGSPVSTAGSIVTRTDDALKFPIGFPPRALTAYLKFQERGSVQLASARLFQIGDASGNAAYFAVDMSGGFYRADHNNVSAGVVSALAVAPAFLDSVEIVAWLNADGSVQISQSINGAAATTASVSAANALASAWSGNFFWLGSAGLATAQGYACFQRVLVLSGLFTLAECQAVSW